MSATLDSYLHRALPATKEGAWQTLALELASCVHTMVLRGWEMADRQTLDDRFFALLGFCSPGSGCYAFLELDPPFADFEAHVVETYSHEFQTVVSFEQSLEETVNLHTSLLRDLWC